MIRVEDKTEAEKTRSRGIMDLAPRRGNLYDFDPRLLRIEEGWNVRVKNFDPDDEEDMILARSIAKVGVKSPITVYMKDGVPTVTDGHRRLCAALYAIDTLKSDLKSVPVQTETRGADEADRILSMDVRNGGRPLQPHERASLYARLSGLGWSPAQIAEKTGRTKQYVSNLLDFREGPSEVVKMVEAGEVSATLALGTLRAAKGDGVAATKTLTKARDTARAAGKTRATAKHVERGAPDLSKHLAYAAGLRRAMIICQTLADQEPDVNLVGAMMRVSFAIDAEVGKVSRP